MTRNRRTEPMALSEKASRRLVRSKRKNDRLFEAGDARYDLGRMTALVLLALSYDPVHGAPLGALIFAGSGASDSYSQQDELARRDRTMLNAYLSPQLYRGPIQLPDFARRDREYSEYRTRIRNGMRKGPNFAGHMALIEIGCGTSCLSVYAGDVASGRVFNFPLGGEGNLSLRLRYNVRSRAVVAYWVDGERCIREAYIWREPPSAG